MKTKKFHLTLGALILAFAIVVTSCKKKDKEENDSDTTEATDHGISENISSDITNIGSQASDNNSGGLMAYKGINTAELLSGCATVKHDSINKIDSVIFNNSTCIDGRTRNGILIFDYSASIHGAKHYRDPGFNCTVKSVNYVVDGHAINIISKNIVNTTALNFNPAETNLTWNMNAHIQINKAAGGTIDYTCNRTKTLLNTNDANVYHGPATAITWNLARIGITGTANGTTAKGINFTANTTSMMIRDFGACNISGKHPFIQGALDFTPQNKATRHLDFGNGSCDLDATVTINGKTHNITLK